MARAFVAIGSNIDPQANIRESVRRLSREVKVIAVSTVYQTKPQGRPEEPLFYNCVIEIETGISPSELKYRILRKIESDLGRQRSIDKYAPRTIDLDLIIYDDLVLEKEVLTLPDPEILERPFLAVPLAELAPVFILPGSGLPIKCVSDRMDKTEMEPLTGLTQLLREEIQDESEPRKN